MDVQGGWHRIHPPKKCEARGQALSCQAESPGKELVAQEVGNPDPSDGDIVGEGCAAWRVVGLLVRTNGGKWGT
jgi:hypothetical protein